MHHSSESGRSLLEIIAVISIMGVFSIGSIVAFQAGMNSVRAKYIAEQVQLRVEEVVSNTELSKGHKKTVYTPEYANKTGEDKYGYRFQTKNATQNTKTMAYMLMGAAVTAPTVQVEVSGRISSGVCESLKGKMSILGNVQEFKADGINLLTQPCPKDDINKIEFTIKKSKISS